MATVPERTTQYVTYAFKDSAGASAVPISGRYRIDNLTAGRQVRDWTSIPGLAASGQITVSAAETAVLNRVHAVELLAVQIEGTYSVNDQAREVIEIEIERVHGHD